MILIQREWMSSVWLWVVCTREWMSSKGVCRPKQMWKPGAKVIARFSLMNSVKVALGS